MDHLAIMNPKWHLIEKILSGEKTIESRWYVHKISPWDKIKAGDTVYFKDAGKQVSAKETVERIIQKELLSIDDGKNLTEKYHKQLCFSAESLIDFTWLDGKKYAILIFLSHAQETLPFSINKSGYGIACAWISTENIDTLRII